jgi:predicted DNA-binding transcriptional regulator AlpA
MQYIQSQLLTVKQVAAMMSMSVSGVWAAIKKDRQFPQPLKVSAQRTRWKLSDVIAFIDIRAQAAE